MERRLRAAREGPVKRNKFLNLRNLAGKDKAIGRQSQRLRSLCGFHCRANQCLTEHGLRRLRVFGLTIFIHQPS